MILLHLLSGCVPAFDESLERDRVTDCLRHNLLDRCDAISKDWLEHPRQRDIKGTILYSLCINHRQAESCERAGSFAEHRAKSATGIDRDLFFREAGYVFLRGCAVQLEANPGTPRSSFKLCVEFDRIEAIVAEFEPVKP